MLLCVCSPAGLTSHSTVSKMVFEPGCQPATFGIAQQTVNAGGQVMLNQLLAQFKRLVETPFIITSKTASGVPVDVTVRIHYSSLPEEDRNIFRWELENCKVRTSSCHLLLEGADREAASTLLCLHIFFYILSSHPACLQCRFLKGVADPSDPDIYKVNTKLKLKLSATSIEHAARGAAEAAIAAAGLPPQSLNGIHFLGCLVNAANAAPNKPTWLDGVDASSSSSSTFLLEADFFGPAFEKTVTGPEGMVQSFKRALRDFLPSIGLAKTASDQQIRAGLQRVRFRFKGLGGSMMGNLVQSEFVKLLRDTYGVRPEFGIYGAQGLVYGLALSAILPQPVIRQRCVRDVAGSYVA